MFRLKDMGTRIALACLLLTLCAVPALAGHHEEGPTRKAIVLAAFGTSYPKALDAILNIKSRVEKANPGIPVKLAFTSSIIRKKWQKRQTDAVWLKANPGIPREVLFVKNPLATITLLQNDGYKDITVQSLHVFPGEEYENLKSMMIALDSIKTLRPGHAPFVKLRLGRTALGAPGNNYSYMEDTAAAVKTLKADAAEAREMGAALVYMGHGNDYFPSSSYAQFEDLMNEAYDVPVLVGCVEGYPGLDNILNGLKQAGTKKVLMKPLMVVAGDHASNDMAGDEDDSWKVILTKAGYEVTTELRGLGSVDAWADLYVNNLKDAMKQPHMLP